MSNRTILNWIVALGVIILLAGTAVGIKLSKSKSPIVLEKDFTPEQKAVLNALRAARADVERSKAELAEMIANARANLIAVQPNANQPISWMVLISSGKIAEHPVNRNDQKPIVWGFRNDGAVVWKYQ